MTLDDISSDTLAIVLRFMELKRAYLLLFTVVIL